MKYVAYGLSVCSDIKLPLLKVEKPSSNNHDLRVYLNKTLSIPLKYKDSDSYTSCNASETIYHRKNIGTFLITKNYIEINPIKSVDNKDFARVLFGLPFGYFFLMNNKVVFHGSAVKYKKKVNIFLGKSGMGKSSIVYDLLKLGSQFVTEDICCINNKEVVYSLPIIKLSSKLINDVSFFNKYKDITFKSDHLNRSGFKIKKSYLSKMNNHLGNCYIFNEIASNDVKIEELENKDSIPYLVQNSFKAHPIKYQKEFFKENLKNIVEFANQTKVYLVSSSKNNLDDRNTTVINHINSKDVDKKPL